MDVIMIKGKQNLIYTASKVLVAGVTALAIFGSACSSAQKAEDIIKQPKSYQIKENTKKENETQYKGTQGNNEQGVEKGIKDISETINAVNKNLESRIDKLNESINKEREDRKAYEETKKLVYINNEREKTLVDVLKKAEKYDGKRGLSFDDEANLAEKMGYPGVVTFGSSFEIDYIKANLNDVENNKEGEKLTPIMYIKIGNNKKYLIDAGTVNNYLNVRN